MKAVLAIATLFVSMTTFAQDSTTWCFCQNGDTQIVRSMPDMPGAWDTTWLVQGSPSENEGKACGKDGYIVDDYGTAVNGPFSTNDGVYSACFSLN